MNRRKHHDDVAKRTLALIYKTFGADEVFGELNPIGYDEAHRTRYGTEGTSDIRGTILIHTGHSLPWYIEVKTGTGDLQKNQIKWMERCNRLKIPHIIMYVKAPENETAIAVEVMNVLRAMQHGIIDDFSRSQFVGKRLIDVIAPAFKKNAEA